jgi:hypothetical protein
LQPKKAEGRGQKAEEEEELVFYFFLLPPISCLLPFLVDIENGQQAVNLLPEILT